MPTNKQVADLIEKWSGKRPDSVDQSLEEWWNQTAPGSSHSALAFDPDGIDDLVKRVKDTFPPPPTIVAGDLKSGGSIKTVQDLVDALFAPASTAAAREQDVADEASPISKTVRGKRKKAISRTGARSKKGKSTGGKRKELGKSKKLSGKRSKRSGSGKDRDK